MHTCRWVVTHLGEVARSHALHQPLAAVVSKFGSDGETLQRFSHPSQNMETIDNVAKNTVPAVETKEIFKRQYLFDATSANK